MPQDAPTNEVQEWEIPMTNELLNAFWNLRKCERQRVLSSMGYNIHQHSSETSLDYCTRVCRQVCNDGKVRELESEMREFQ